MSNLNRTYCDDINDRFDDIFLTEEKHSQLGYSEGVQEGQEQGNREGYSLGFIQGVQLGSELGNIYGKVVYELQLEHSQKIIRKLNHVRQLIEQFPRSNADVDIVSAVEEIRNAQRALSSVLTAKTTDNHQEDQKPNLSF